MTADAADEASSLRKMLAEEKARTAALVKALDDVLWRNLGDPVRDPDWTADLHRLRAAYRAAGGIQDPLNQ